MTHNKTMLCSILFVVLFILMGAFVTVYDDHPRSRKEALQMDPYNPVNYSWKWEEVKP